MTNVRRVKLLTTVRYCKNSACHRNLWNQDINAPINILKLVIDQMKGKRKLKAFITKKIAL